jgi:hypothetical protein
MIRLRGTVTYDTGQTAEWQAGSAVFVAWESYCRRQAIAEPYGQGNVNTMAHFCAYTALGVQEGFEVWLRSVVDVETAEAAEVPPTLEGVQAG